MTRSPGVDGDIGETVNSRVGVGGEVTGDKESVGTVGGCENDRVSVRSSIERVGSRRGRGGRGRERTVGKVGRSVGLEDGSDTGNVVNLEVLEVVDVGGESEGSSVPRVPLDGESESLGSNGLGQVLRRLSGGDLVLDQSRVLVWTTVGRQSRSRRLRGGRTWTYRFRRRCACPRRSPGKRRTSSRSYRRHRSRVRGQQ